MKLAWALQRRLFHNAWAPPTKADEPGHLVLPPLRFPKATLLPGDDDLGYGYLERWRLSEQDLVSPVSEEGTRIRLFSLNAPDTPVATHPHVVVDAENLILDFGRIGRRDEPRHRPGYLRSSGAYADYHTGALVADACKATPFRPGLFPRDHLRDVFESLEVTDRGSASDQTVSDVSFFMTREPREYTNLFHAHTDWLAAFVAMRLLRLEESPSRIMLLDRHPRGALDSGLGRLFSRHRPVARLDDFGSHRVRFRRAVFVSPGYSSILWARQHEEVPGPPIGLLTDYGRFLCSAFTESRPQPTFDGPVRIVLLSRRPYPGRGPMLMRRFRSEAAIITALRSLADVTVEEFDPAPLALVDQIQMANRIEILIGAHGAGLAHIFAMAEHGAVVEIVPAPSDATYRLYPNIAAWTDRLFRRIECSEALGLRGSFLDPDPVELLECVSDLARQVRQRRPTH